MACNKARAGEPSSLTLEYRINGGRGEDNQGVTNRSMKQLSWGWNNPGSEFVKK